MAGRPLTPHKSVGFKKVEGELTTQINSIKSSKAKAEADKRLIERLYQIQLAEGYSTFFYKMAAYAQPTYLNFGAVKDTDNIFCRTKNPVYCA